MTIRPPKILVQTSSNEYSFLAILAERAGLSVESFVTGLITEMIEKAQKRETSRKSPNLTVDQVLDQVRSLNGEDATTQ